jgi:hypothetical protein
MVKTVFLCVCGVGVLDERKKSGSEVGMWGI